MSLNPPKERLTHEWSESARVARLKIGKAPMRAGDVGILEYEFQKPEDLERFIRAAEFMLHLMRGGSCGCEEDEHDE